MIPVERATRSGATFETSSQTDQSPGSKQHSSYPENGRWRCDLDRYFDADFSCCSPRLILLISSLYTSLFRPFVNTSAS